tara:strand:+ start:151 stop:1593 length:1443 start_codon:yes stop_codon:yes gene_type:complete
MSKKTPVFTPIDSGIKKKDAPTPIKRKREEKEKEKAIVNKTDVDLMNLLSRIDEVDEEIKDEKKKSKSISDLTFKPITDSKNTEVKEVKEIKQNKPKKQKKTGLIKPIPINNYDSEGYESALGELEDEAGNIELSEKKEIESYLKSLNNFVDTYEEHYLNNHVQFLKNSDFVSIKNSLLSITEILIDKMNESKKIKQYEEEVYDLYDKILNMFSEKSDIIKKKYTLKKSKSSGFSQPKKGGSLLKSSKKKKVNPKKAIKKTKKLSSITTKSLKKTKSLKQIIKTESTDSPSELYQKRILGDKIDNWRNLIEQGTPTSLKDDLYDCTYNALYFLDDINYKLAKDGSKKTNCNKDGISIHEFFEEFKKLKDYKMKQKLRKNNFDNNKSLKSYNYEIKKVCMQDIVRTIKLGHATYMLFGRESGIGHAVIVARDLKNEFFILDPQRKIFEKDLFSYLHNNKITTTYTILQKPIIIKAKYLLRK